MLFKQPGAIRFTTEDYLALLAAVCDSLGQEALRQHDLPRSRAAWALKAQALYGRPEQKRALAALRVEQLPGLIHHLRAFSPNLGAAWLAVPRLVVPVRPRPGQMRHQALAIPRR